MTIPREHLTHHLRTLALAALLITIFTLRGFAQETVKKPDSQAISQTGLLPVYGIDLNIDPAWVDGAQFPSGSSSYPSFGARPVLQKVWDALKTAGYNTLRFEVDVRDAQSSATRVANLCVWAKNNNVKLTPVLIGADRGKSLGNEYPANVSAFIKALLAALRTGEGLQMEVYTQILAYQLENEMNHAGLHAAMSAEAAQLRLLQTASALRRAEQESLKETGLNQTPIVINASFDYELVKARAMAGTTLTDDAYTKAYDSLKQFVSGIALSSDIDVIGVDWFAGSLSAGSVDKFSAILRSLTTDLAGKQVVFTTGFSTGFRPAEEQRNFYALAFNKLAGYRASDGADSSFIGAFFHEALIGKAKNAALPMSNIETDMTKWNWTAQADELARMWSGKKNSDAMVWWLSKVEDNFGLLTLKLDSSGNANITAQPAQEALAQVANAVDQANQPTAADTTTNQPAGDEVPSNPNTTDVQNAGSTSTGLGSALKETAKQGLMNLLNAAFQRLGNYLSGVGSNNINGSNSDGGVSLGSGNLGATGDVGGNTGGGGTTGVGTDTNDSVGVGGAGSTSSGEKTPGTRVIVDPVRPSASSKSTVPVRPILPPAFKVKGVSVPVKTSGAKSSMPGGVKVANPVRPIEPKQEEPTRPRSVRSSEPSKPAEPATPTGSRPVEPSKPSPQRVVEPAKPSGPRSADGSKQTTPSVVAPPRSSDRTSPNRAPNNGHSGVNRNQTPTRPPQIQRLVIVPAKPSRRR